MNRKFYNRSRLSAVFGPLWFWLAFWPVLVAGSGGIWFQHELQHPCSMTEQLNITSNMDNHNCATRGPQGNTLVTILVI